MDDPLNPEQPAPPEDTHRFEDVLAATVSSLVRARHLADLESMAIAEQYRDHPLLRNFSVPRMRVPEMRVDLPVLVDTVTHERQITGTDIDRITDGAAQHLQTSLTDPVPENAVGQATSALGRLLRQHHGKAGLSETECHDLAHRARAVVAEALASVADTGAAGTGPQPAVDAVHRFVHDELLSRARRSPRLAVRPRTTAVKEESNPASVSRLQLVIREEGLEWNTTMAPDGSTQTNLIHE
ncbi:hypothetical protein KIH74_34625 [Kineosporia sp. J2-2]|uniref:DUF222 domain-containing protein n=1 Tax=Kineosporia corallincola TaxID=2835133 RepID=A0ABS5TTJ5_9ACTN|nr:hypothetical protein [Kineosporia corallincola]MBT0774132.1 hypothetical protein [Kineosporia corallincola]